MSGLATVAHLSSAHDPLDVRIFHKECRSLAQAGYDVTVIAPGSGDQVLEGIHVRTVARAKSRPLRMTQTACNVAWQALRLRADLYHFHDPELIPVGLLLRCCGKRVVYDIHEDVPRDMLAKEYLHPWQRKLLASAVEALESIASRCFSALIAVTPTIEQRFASKSPTILVRNYPRVEELPRTGNVLWDERPQTVSYIGAIAAERGIREIVEAMSLLPSNLRGKLKIASASFPQPLYDEVSTTRGWEHVEYLGHLNRIGIADLLQHVRAGLVTFHPEPNNVAALPHKLFEYMAAGVPVIASAFPLWKQIIGGHECGLLVDPMKPESIACAIEYVLTHPREAEQMGSRGRAAVDQFYNWSTEEHALLELYRSLLN